MKGLRCSIYRPHNGSRALARAPGCSNGGISEDYDSCVLVGSDIPQIFSPSVDAPMVKLEERYLVGPVAIPSDQPKGLRGPMFGGSFIYTSDSRFPSEHPIPLHDRWETQALAEPSRELQAEPSRELRADALSR